MFQWIISAFQYIVALCGEATRSNSVTDSGFVNRWMTESNESGLLSQMDLFGSNMGITSDLFSQTGQGMGITDTVSSHLEWSTSDTYSSSSYHSEPLFNIDGTPMCGSVDINGNPYGVTGSLFDSSCSISSGSDSFSSFSSVSDSFSSFSSSCDSFSSDSHSSFSSSSDSFSSMGCSSDW